MQAQEEKEEGGDWVCSLTTADKIELNFLAAQNYMEVALVEIHADDELSKGMSKLQGEDEELSKVIQLIKRKSVDLKDWKCVPKWYRQNRERFVISKDVLYHIKKG